MSTLARDRIRSTPGHRSPGGGLPLWARVTMAIASVVVSLTLFGAVSIGLTTPSFDLSAVAASTGRYLEPVAVLAQTPADD